VSAAGCGSVGEPLYPALNIPTRIGDLTAVERGDRIEINFTIGPRTTEGLALKEIGGVELRVGPNASAAFNVDQWASGAKRIDVETPSQPGPVSVPIRVQDFVGQELLVAVRVANAKGRASEWSNIIIVNVEAPLSKPAGLKASAEPAGVRLTWTAGNGRSFRIFRKLDQEKELSTIATVDQPEYVDASTEYGKSYTYYVQSIHDKTESEIAGPESIVPKDIFPPRVPVGLTASAGIAAIELAWERNTEPDFKEYRVYRSGENGPFLPIAEGLEGPSYSDRKIESGKHYRYRIAAVDLAGNPSELSAPVEIIAP
jgi:hypothetical protein